MIKKELDPFEGSDKYAVSGRKAEEKMAFYLKRFFSSHSDIHVLNHIRLEANDDAAQIDHLLVHPYGMAIVESKSVHGKLQFKDDGQWIRWYGKESKGMASPVTQARLQAQFLKDVLNDAAKPKGFFDGVPVDVMVAISDDGVIIWPKAGVLNEVCKADQVADRITATVAQANKEGIKPILDGGHIEKICAFLCTRHTPLAQRALTHPENPTKKPEETASVVLTVEQPVAKYQVSSTLKSNACQHCKGTKLEILFGHNYYFHCLDCQKNTPIKNACPTCNAQKKTRKQKKQFFAECAICNTSELFFENP